MLDINTVACYYIYILTFCAFSRVGVDTGEQCCSELLGLVVLEKVKQEPMRIPVSRSFRVACVLQDGQPWST